MKFPTPKPGLLTHELDNQVVVYDSGSNRVHLLDSATAGVLRSLQVGSALPSDFDKAGDLKDDLYSIAIDELSKAELISEPEAPLSDMSRREMLRRIGMVGAGALLIPAVVTLTPGSAFAASGCDSSINNGGSMCVSGTPCCTTDSTGALISCKGDNMCYRVNGEPCTQGNQCFSTMCNTCVCGP